MPRADTAADSLQRPVLGSLLVHGLVLASALGYGLWRGKAADPFGSDNPMAGGSIGVNTVSRIPIVTPQGPRNPLANQSESVTPAPPPPPKPEPRRAPVEDPDAVALKGRPQPQSRQPSRPPAYVDPDLKRSPNQVYDRGGPAVNNPMYGVPGTGGIGLTEGSPFRGRFGWYEQLIRRRVAERWDVKSLDPFLRTAPPAVVTFEIQKDGRVRNVRVATSSGNYALDRSTERAVLDAAPFPPLPPGFERDLAGVELLFRLQR